MGREKIDTKRSQRINAKWVVLKEELVSGWWENNKIESREIEAERNFKQARWVLKKIKAPKKKKKREKNWRGVREKEDNILEERKNVFVCWESTKQNLFRRKKNLH